MKKIGILYGKERSFPAALVERINALNEPGLTAEAVDRPQLFEPPGGLVWAPVMG